MLSYLDRLLLPLILIYLLQPFNEEMPPSDCTRPLKQFQGSLYLTKQEKTIELTRDQALL